MASGVYDDFVEDMLEYIFNVSAPTEVDDLYGMYCMTNFSFSSGNATVSAITTDECDDTGYSAGGVQCGSETVINKNALDIADLQYASLNGNATRQGQGILYYDERGASSSDFPVCWQEFSGTIPTTATQVDVTIHATGLLLLS